MADLTEYLLSFNAQVKLFHWQTMSRSRHKASDKLHKKMLDLTDRLIEARFGRYGRLGIRGGVYKLDNLGDVEFMKYLQVFNSNIASLRTTLGNNDTDQQAIMDEIIEVVNQAIYLCSLN